MSVRCFVSTHTYRPLRGKFRAVAVCNVTDVSRVGHYAWTQRYCGSVGAVSYRPVLQIVPDVRVNNRNEFLSRIEHSPVVSRPTKRSLFQYRYELAPSPFARNENWPTDRLTVRFVPGNSVTR